ncbi:hypothetical protein LSTR_LSTR002628 [Laodelphax striatellus]|uniref:Uncharacterized protein n=1 Tax=Laodelphax striatellus TaxID=195883 RepID=A0A482XKZ5_LAOST|nr:hypothetical protein LSTR_LSTR016928 [Laodelphax striatellus]RZF46765.1 hypothetical protein LSTR_LSTR002628 [Laodelphax striatellus]
MRGLKEGKESCMKEGSGNQEVSCGKERYAFTRSEQTRENELALGEKKRDEWEESKRGGEKKDRLLLKRKRKSCEV